MQEAVVEMDHPAPAGHALEEVRAAPADMVDIPDLIAPPGQGVVTSNTRVVRVSVQRERPDRPIVNAKIGAS